MAAQYDSESKGERNLAFKPVGPFHMLPRCTADLFHARQKAQFAETPKHELLALSCSFSSCTAHRYALQCMTVCGRPRSLGCAGCAAHGSL